MGLEIADLSRLRELGQGQYQHLIHWLPLVATIALIVAIAHGLADLTWRLVPVADEHGSPQAGARTALTASRDDPASVNLDRLIDMSVFGDPDPADEQQDLNLAEMEAPETQLNLELRGVLATEIPEMAMAIIASGRGDDKSYRVGDSIGSGASLRAVYSDRVILERGGDLETLRLPRDDEGMSDLNNGRRNGDHPSSSSDQEVTVPDELVDLRSAIQENPERITDVIRPTPHHVDGQMVGFRIFPGRMREQFQALGLRAGDIVTAINGQPMDSPAAGMSLMNELQNANSVQLTIDRGGRETSITISLSN